MSELFPSGLTRSQFDQLSELVERSADQSPESLQTDVSRHLAATEAAFAKNRLVNVRLATAIVGRIETTIADWESLPTHARPWLKGAFAYFISDDDEEPDFESAIGFEDDAEILNACLKFAGREDLCLKVEDYDDV